MPIRSNERGGVHGHEGPRYAWDFTGLWSEHGSTVKHELPEHERYIHTAFGVNSALYLPLLRDGECIGLLALTCNLKRVFSAKEISVNFPAKIRANSSRCAKSPSRKSRSVVVTA